MDGTAWLVRWIVRAGIAISILAIVTSAVLIWLYLTNPIAVAHMVEQGLAATAVRVVGLVATTVIRAARFL